MTVPFSDIGIYIASLLLIGGYHLYLRIRLRRNRAYTIQSINYNARVAWVENIMSDKSRGILAVQTLRNSTMAATFLASTAILMSMGVLNLMQKGDADNSLLHALQNNLLTGGEFGDIKLLILLGTFFLAFFSFSMAVRMYNHVGYLINSSNDKLRFKPSTSYVSKLLNRSGDYYSFGMRAYYISVPMMFSLFNPYYMIVASIGLVIFLYNIDRAPKEEVSISQHVDDDNNQTESSLFLFRNRKSAAATVSPNNNISQTDLSNEESRIIDNVSSG
jgi:uncharacterized membrane protein